MRQTLQVIAIIFSLIIIVSLSNEAFAQTNPNSAESKQTQEEVDVLIGKLENPAFHVRDFACKQLTLAGKISVQPLLQKAQNGSLDAQILSVRVLGGLYSSDEAEVKNAAAKALERLTHSDVNSISRRAYSILNRKLENAIEQIGGLGGDIEKLPNGNYTVWIGDFWDGTPKDLKLIKDLGNVEVVDLEGSLLDEDALKHLSPMPSLRVLNLTYADISNGSLKRLSGFPNLQELNLSHTFIGNPGVEEIAKNKNLTILSLSGTKVGDKAIKSLLKLENLEHLSLRKTKLTSEGFQQLINLKKLKSLDVRNSKFSLANLESFATLKDLKEIDLRKSKVTEDEVNEFKKKHNDIKIEFRKPKKKEKPKIGARLFQ